MCSLVEVTTKQPKTADDVLGLSRGDMDFSTLNCAGCPGAHTAWRIAHQKFDAHQSKRTDLTFISWGNRST